MYEQRISLTEYDHDREDMRAALQAASTFISNKNAYSSDDLSEMTQKFYEVLKEKREYLRKEEAARHAKSVAVTEQILGSRNTVFGDFDFDDEGTDRQGRPVKEGQSRTEARPDAGRASGWRRHFRTTPRKGT